MAYFKNKYECFNCGALFSIITLHPEQISIDTIFCPVCGASEGPFIGYSEIEDGDMDDEIPGSSEISVIGKNILDDYTEGCQVSSLRLKPGFREMIAEKKQSVSQSHD